MRKYLRRPSPAMFVAIAALVWATCGSAIADGVNATIAALKPNSVTGKTVKNGSLTLADFNKKERAKLTGATGPAGPAGAAGPQGPAGTPNGYTKTEADAAFLTKGGLAADSDRLDGKSSSSFINGTGTQSFGSLLMNFGDADATLVSLPDLGTIKAGCAAGTGNMDITVTNTQSAVVRYTYALTASGSSALIGGTQLAASGGGGDSFNHSFAATNHQLIMQLLKTTGFGVLRTSAAATLLLTAVRNPTGDSSKCRYQAQTLTGSSGIGVISLPPVILP